MKKHRFTLAAAALILFIGVGMSFLSSCEGPAGLAGTDANESCTQCHNNDGVLEAKILQASASAHQTGSSFERNGTDCATCHTSQGFIERVNTGELETAEAVSNPIPVGCTTCHTIHENYDSTDYALRVTEPVTLDMNGVTIDLGSANVCATCHQPRTPSPVVDLTSTAMVTIDNSRWGPHHGTQAAMVGGTAAYEVEGSVSYPSSKAHISAGCNSCHMAEAYGSQAGGHTFGMTYLYHGHDAVNLAGCTECHSGIEDDIPSPDFEGKMTEIEGLIATLKARLEGAEILNPADGLVNVPRGGSIQITVDQAAALYNYFYVMEDRSKGIHNPSYAKALLQNSIEVFPV